MVAGAALVVAAAGLLDGDGWSAVVIAAAMVVFAWTLSPAFFPRGVPFEQARDIASARGVPLILWRPGCTYCMRLRMALASGARRVMWVNIWDDDAARFVRSVNSGNETVPTVVVGGQAHTNPSPRWVRLQLFR
ncbi:glutaredoxin [Haloactinopolyspora alba]|uniref:Glutaredoxin n=1 Tax=Haloactinopolyspora alba TaxID=648780 RepID=A0A2P8DX56_9ACTN|nr:glutaredoxin domain-containing protein [Haloactinopolyspora alba]PSL01809.1 glutaredoxin [Haloactinopolyspora alba]